MADKKNCHPPQIYSEKSYKIGFTSSIALNIIKLGTILVLRGHSHLEGGFTKETSSFGGRGGSEKNEKLLIDFCLFLEFTGLKLDCENF